METPECGVVDFRTPPDTSCEDKFIRIQMKSQNRELLVAAQEESVVERKKSLLDTCLPY